MYIHVGLTAEVLDFVDSRPQFISENGERVTSRAHGRGRRKYGNANNTSKLHRYVWSLHLCGYTPLRPLKSLREESICLGEISLDLSEVHTENRPSSTTCSFRSHFDPSSRATLTGTEPSYSITTRYKVAHTFPTTLSFTVRGRRQYVRFQS